MIEVHSAPSGEIWGSFDTFEGQVVTGWAWNPRDSRATTIVDFYCDGILVGSAEARGYREDVFQAGFGSGYAAFYATLNLDLNQSTESIVTACVRDGSVELVNSPRKSFLPEHYKKWLTRKSRATSSTVSRMRRHLNRKTAEFCVSIIMPVYKTRHDWLRTAVDSVRAQWCDRWQLICIDDGSNDREITSYLENCQAEDPRIKLKSLSSNQGIAAATNFGISEASGTHVTFLDHDDYLEPDAVFHLLNAAKTDADLIYSDELITGEDVDAVIGFAARPAFSHDFYLSHPYFVHMIAVKIEIAREVGGWNRALQVSGDVDFVLRVIERSKIVTHVPAMIYRWRTHGQSAGHQKRQEVMNITQEALAGHLRRLRRPATVSHGSNFNTFKIEPPDSHGKTLIVIPTKNRVDLLRACVESLETTIDPSEFSICVIDHESDDPPTRKYLNSLRNRHKVYLYRGEFNYSKMNNLVAFEYGPSHKFVVFMNNDIEAFQEGWLRRMRSLASRVDVGIVGCNLIYGDGRIQHSGVILGIQGKADHAHRFKDLMIGQRPNPGYLCSLTAVREYSAVTAACMMMRFDTFQRVNGFDENLVVGFNDTDLCMRVFHVGLKVLNDGYTVLFHHESATRAKSVHATHELDNEKFSRKWKQFLTDGDFFYNPLLGLYGVDHELAKTREETRNVGIPRVVSVTF